MNFKQYIKASDQTKVRKSMMGLNREEKVEIEERKGILSPFGNQTRTTWKEEKDPRSL